MQAVWPTKFSPIQATLLRDRVFWYTLPSALTLTSRLFICLLIVILVGVTLVVAWPLILIGATIVALSKGIDAWKKRPPTIPPVAGESGRLVSPLGDEAEAVPTR
jgi:hypothetical protein